MEEGRKGRGAGLSMVSFLRALILLACCIVSCRVSAFDNVKVALEQFTTEAELAYDSVLAEDDRAKISRDLFVANFVTLSLERATDKILAAKGLDRSAIELTPEMRSGHELKSEQEMNGLRSMSKDFGEGISKKDAPVTMGGMLEQMQVQKMQAELVAQNNRTGKSQRWLDTPAKGATLDDGGPTFSGASSAKYVAMEERRCARTVFHGSEWYAPVPQCTVQTPQYDRLNQPFHVQNGDQNSTTNSASRSSTMASIPCQRVVRDGVASTQECATVAGTAERAMWRLFHQGGATSFVPDNSVVRLVGGSINGGLAFVRLVRRKYKLFARQ